MVSFSCEGCGDILTKKKLDGHQRQCRAEFTCIDCMQTFEGFKYRTHTSCISEAQKYQGALYRGDNKKKGANANANANNHAAPARQPVAPTQKAYVEDADDEDTDAPPAVPSPPTEPAEPINVFDFLVQGDTPNPSKLDLTAPDAMVEDTTEGNNTQLVRVHFDENGQNAVPAEGFETPAPKVDRKKKESKKSGEKRKRLHVDTHDLSLVHVPREGDEVMTDAPPTLVHSGLTGGIKNMLQVFPPSPDYSGGDADAISPGSPLKRTKHSKHDRRRETGITNSIMAMIAPPKRKTKSSKEKTSKKSKSKSKAKKDSKLIEYKGDGAGASQMVLYKNPADTDLFMSLINKGPESSRGCSVNKCLKRYHRERAGQGVSRRKEQEEKDLFRALRLRRNDQGEIVVFFEESA